MRPRRAPAPPRSGMRELFVETVVTQRRGLPAEVLLHCMMLGCPPLVGPVEQGESAPDRGRERSEFEAMENETRRKSVGEVFERGIDDRVRESSNPVNERQG